MANTLIIIIGLAEALVIVAVMYAAIMRRRSEAASVLEKLEAELLSKQDLKQRMEALCAEMVEVEQAREKVRELLGIQEALKVERGRITITQAELETVENRLRELEEIERELEASGLETKEELKILQKKERDLTAKNETLKQQIEESVQEMASVTDAIELNAQSEEQIQLMKNQLLQTQSQIDALMLQIEQGNEQYFVLKKRYDALDIEYAQLYEKFAEVEEEKKPASS